MKMECFPRLQRTWVFGLLEVMRSPAIIIAFLLLDGLFHRTVGLPAKLSLSSYGDVHPLLPQKLQARVLAEGCGDWKDGYAKAHLSARAADVGATWPRYAVMVSRECGLGDRLTSSLSIFLYALLTNRTFEYVWYGNHDLWTSFQSTWIDWRSPHVDSAAKTSAAPTITENHAWANPARTRFNAQFYLLNNALRESLRHNFSNLDITKIGAQADVVVCNLNQGLLGKMFHNPTLTALLAAVGLSYQHAVACLFNYLYVPSPEALAPFSKPPGLLDKLLDPDSYIISIQVRVGDWIFDENKRHQLSENHEKPWYDCAMQLTDDLVSRGLASAPQRQEQQRQESQQQQLQEQQRTQHHRRWSGGFGGFGRQRQLQGVEAGAAGQRPKRVYWFLVSDSEKIRERALQRYPDLILTAHGLPIDHIQDKADRGQMGLHVAAGEMWLLGLADAHVITINSAYGRLGALAGLVPGKQQLVYGIRPFRPRWCRLDTPDSLDYIASWWIGLRH